MTKRTQSSTLSYIVSVCLLTGCLIHWHLENKEALSQFSMDNLDITIQRKKRKRRGGGKEGKRRRRRRRKMMEKKNGGGGRGRSKQEGKREEGEYEGGE